MLWCPAARAALSMLNQVSSQLTRLYKTNIENIIRLKLEFEITGSKCKSENFVKSFRFFMCINLPV